MSKLYWNNAATSFPKAPGLGAHMAAVMERLPGASHRASGEENAALDARALLAALLGVQDKARIVYTQNSTQALNIALLGFPWKKEDVALTTAAEHNSMLRPLYALKQQGRIKDFIVLPVQKDGRLSEATLSRAVKEHAPRLCAFLHASNVTGAINDAAALAAVCKKAGAVTVLDASQTMGLVPVLPEAWGIDMLAVTGHKYLLGPQGTGCLYVREDIKLSPVYTGGTGIHSDSWTMPETLPLRLEAGTPNEQGMEGLAYSLQWLAAHPLDAAALDRNMAILEEGLLSSGAVPVRVEGARTPVMAFTSAMPPADMGEVLNEAYDIICRTGLHCAPLLPPYAGFDPRGSVRLSMSRFTSREEVESVVQAVKEILA
ncbi:MAG: aminotransferase class V-fold PLP-dependent enzyme [Clostridia bacterium]|nr:aminotransferase class V-fold PLP-dependent enzyme [Clostridia bacterium]